MVGRDGGEGWGNAVEIVVLEGRKFGRFVGKTPAGFSLFVPVQPH
jgi:hypothetical protein